jgi:hypothetical protein
VSKGISIIMTQGGGEIIIIGFEEPHRYFILTGTTIKNTNRLGSHRNSDLKGGVLS